MTREVETVHLERLFAEHGQKVYAFCLKLCGNRQDAEDLAAEVFIDAPASLGRFRGDSSEETWFYRMALNKHRARSRAHARWIARVTTIGRALRHDNTEAELVYEIAVSQALARLSVKQRQAFLLIKSHGLRYAEAAALLGVPVGTVQSRVHEASKRMADLLELPIRAPFAEISNEV